MQDLLKTLLETGQIVAVEEEVAAAVVLQRRRLVGCMVSVVMEKTLCRVVKKMQSGYSRC